MAMIDLYSKREAEKLGCPEVVQYDVLPQPFRVQVVQLLLEGLGHWDMSPYYGEPLSNALWEMLYKLYVREKGVFYLVDDTANPCHQFTTYLMVAPTADAIDMIDIAFRAIYRSVRAATKAGRRPHDMIDPDDAITELNGRFRQHGLGYEFVDGQIIRADSQYIHAEAVRPAVQLLHDAGTGFAGPLQEFMEAHERYLRGDHKDAIVSACKSFESTLKAICQARGWAFDPHNDPAKKLLQIVFDNRLVPDYIQNQLTALKSVLESGVPTVRNKTSGHGQGATPTALPPHFVQYALHTTASNIVLLIECHKAMK